MTGCYSSGFLAFSHSYTRHMVPGYCPRQRIRYLYRMLPVVAAMAAHLVKIIDSVTDMSLNVQVEADNVEHIEPATWDLNTS